MLRKKDVALTSEELLAPGGRPARVPGRPPQPSTAAARAGDGGDQREPGLRGVAELAAHSPASRGRKDRPLAADAHFALGERGIDSCHGGRATRPRQARLPGLRPGAAGAGRAAARARRADPDPVGAAATAAQARGWACSTIPEVDNELELSARLDPDAVPTLVLLDGADERGRVEGLHRERML